MSSAGRKLLGLAGMRASNAEEDDDGDYDNDEDSPDGDEHPGKVQAMKDFHAAHALGDHEGMSKALSAHHDIHMEESKSYHGGNRGN